MSFISVLILILAIGAIVALWSMREYSPGEGRKSIKGKKVRLEGEVGLKGAGEIILPKGHKKINLKISNSQLT